MPQTTAPFPGNSVTLCPLVVMLLTMSYKFCLKRMRNQTLLSSIKVWIYRWETLFVLKFHREQLVMHSRTIDGFLDRFTEPEITDD